MAMTVAEALARDEADVERLEVEIAERQQQLNGLRTRVSVLREVLAASAPVDKDSAVGQLDPTWLSMPRTEAVERVLAERAPVSPRDISKALEAAGRTGDSWQNIGRVLDYLRVHGRARSIGYAQWVGKDWQDPHSRQGHDNVVTLSGTSG